VKSKAEIESYSGFFDHSDHRIVYRLYRHKQVSSGRRLVLLHGAGVAGRHTWEALQRFLTSWSEVLVPDLRGAGDTRSIEAQELPFTVDDLVGDIQALITELNWHQFDLAGYSLGGLVSMVLKQRLPQCVAKQYLLESAALDRLEWSDTLLTRQKFSEAAHSLKTVSLTEAGMASDVHSGIRQFLDTISPNRRITPAVERLTIERLAERSVGFAHALDAVTLAIQQLDRDALLAVQGDVSSFIGSLSVDPMHQLHLSLAERMPNWHYFLIQGTDHSLPYQKPRQIAAIMDQELQRFIATQ